MLRERVFGMRIFRVVQSIVSRAIVISRSGILETGGQREYKDCQSMVRHLNIRYVGTWVELVVRGGGCRVML